MCHLASSEEQLKPSASVCLEAHNSPSRIDAGSPVPANASTRAGYGELAKPQGCYKLDHQGQSCVIWRDWLLCYISMTELRGVEESFGSEGDDNLFSPLIRSNERSKPLFCS